MRKITVHDLLELQEEENLAKRALMLHEMKIPFNAQEAAKLKVLFAKHRKELHAIHKPGNEAEKDCIQELYFLLHSYLKSGLSNYKASMPELKKAYTEAGEKGQADIERLFGGIMWVNQKVHEKRTDYHPQLTRPKA